VALLKEYMLRSINKLEENEEIMKMVKNEEKRLNVEVRRLDVFYKNHNGTRVIDAIVYDKEEYDEGLIMYNDVNPKTLEYENGGEGDKLVSPKRFFNMIRANKWKEIKREVNI
jgi:hypothetical protein